MWCPPDPGKYDVVNFIFESDEVRIATKLMRAKATNETCAVDPIKANLSKHEVEFLSSMISKGYVKFAAGTEMCFLTLRGKLVANMGMKKLVEMNLFPQDDWESMK